MVNLIPFVFLFAAGAIFYLCGVLTLRYPPKERNYVYGYRTPASMRTQERWDYAQKYSANLMKSLGYFLTGLSALGFIISASGSTDLFDHNTSIIFIITPIILAAAYLIGRTEWSLYKNFKSEK